MITYITAIVANHPDISFSSPGDGSVYETIEWATGSTPIAKSVLDAEIIELIKAEAWKNIQAVRDLRTQSGIQVNGYWFHSDQPSRIQQLGLVIMGSSLPSGIMWKTMSGAFVEMTQTLAGQIFQKVASNDMAVFATAEYHRSQMLASADPGNYDYSGSWPLIYGE